MLRNDAPRVAGVAGLGEMRHHVGLGEQRAAFNVSSSGSPGPTPTPIRPRAHSPALARAFTAAAVMALPPMRPRTIR